ARARGVLLMAVAARRVQADMGDAPGPAATWTSEEIASHHDTPTGLVAVGAVLDVFIWCGAEFTWRVEGSHDGLAWKTLDEEATPIAAHTDAGLLFSVAAPT